MKRPVSPLAGAVTFSDVARNVVSFRANAAGVTE
jgi:hypothetical protein